MLLTERVNIYDKLAKALTKKGFDLYRDYIANNDNFNKTSDSAGIVRYIFPKKGVGSYKDVVNSDRILNCSIDFTIEKTSPYIKIFNAMRKRQSEEYIPTAGYKTHGSYIYPKNFLAGYENEKENPDIVIKLVVKNFKEFHKEDFKWNKFYFDILHTVRHELEHQAQYLREAGIPIHHFDMPWDVTVRTSGSYKRGHEARELESHFGTVDKNSQILYNTVLSSEVEAELKAYYLLYKKTKKPLKDVIKTQLKKYDLDSGEINYVLDKWEQYRKWNFKYMPSLK